MKRVNDMSTETLITVKEARKILRLSESGLWRAVRTKKIPKPIKIGSRSARFLLSEIEACIAAAADARRE